MGSSTSGKKHKKDKKHKNRNDEDEIDLTAEVKQHKHKRHKEHKERSHKQKNRSHERERENQEVIALKETDSDSSDCIEVPLDGDVSSSKRRSSVIDQDVSVPPPPPPQLSRQELERERARERDRDRDRDRARERDRYERERHERERDYMRTREKDREQDRHDKERERRERGSDREREYRERHERDRDRERNDRMRHRDRTESTRSDRERDRANKGRSRSRSRSIPENGAGDVLSIEESNKLRAKLGLKPLEVDSGPINSGPDDNKKSNASGAKDLSKYKDEWGEFMHKPADNLAEKAKAEKIRDKLKQHREKRALEDRLARIRTLGESDEEGDDVSQWVNRNKEIVDIKKEAAKRAKMLEEMDAEIEADSEPQKRYRDRDLKGLRVEHDVEEFSEGKTVILTLKDKDILDEKDDDTLINVNMIDDERYKKNVANKKLNPQSYGYNVYEETYDELGNPIERNILEKYDEDVDGKPTKIKKAFVIGENLSEERQQQRKLLEIRTKLAGKRLETLADTQITIASDILSEAELTKFKKPKKKIKKIRQKLKAEDLLPLDDEPMQKNFRSRNISVKDDTSTIGLTEDVEESKDADIKIEDDDAGELERMLSKARKLKQKDKLIQKMMPIDIENIKQEIKVEPDEPIQLRSADGNIILNATAEFCRTLGDIPTYGMAGNRIQDGAEIMDYDLDEDAQESYAREVTDRDMEKPESSHGTWNSVNPDEVMQPADLDNLTQIADIEERAILDEEPDVGAGVANALRLALSKGYLEKDEHNRPSNSKMAHLQAKNYSIEDKSTAEDEKIGRHNRFHGPIMDFKDKDSFKPNVKLEYIDDNGRILNLKEAFRYLSHKFHGKGPGKNKIEKRLKKMEQDGLMKTMSSTDTPLGTLTMLQQKQKETKTPYVVLSGGKQANGGFGPTTLSKFK